MSDIIETLEHKGYTIEVYPDIDPMNPREWDNVGTIACWHRRYDLGDEQITGDLDTWFMGMLDFSYEQEEWYYNKYEGDTEGLMNALRDRMDKRYVILPLFIYDHGGITMSTGSFSCPWDSGQVGYTYVSHKEIREANGWKYLTRKRISQTKEYLKGDVETYDQYLTGSVYGYQVKDPRDNDVDSCSGYYGYDFEANDLAPTARSVIDNDIQRVDSDRREYYRSAWEQLKHWIRHKVPIIYRKRLELYEPY